MITKPVKDNSIAIINHNKYEEKFWNLLIIIFLIILNETALIKQIRSTVNNSNLMIQKDEKWKYINSNRNPPTISRQVLLKSCLQTCMTYTIAECTVNKLLRMDRGTVRNV